MSSRITIKEIAKKANISIGTVDRVLHNRGRVAERTRLKVLEIAKSGNYASNVYARHLRLNKTYTIAIVLPSDTPYWDMQREGISKGISTYEAMGFLCKEYAIKNPDEQSFIDVMEQVFSDAPDGIIVAPGSFTSFKAFSNAGIPYVLVDSNLEVNEKLSFIGQDAFQSGYMAGGLLNHGFVKKYTLFIITFYLKDLVSSVVRARVNGAKQFIKQHNKLAANTTVNICELNLEQDNITLQGLKKIFLENNTPVHLFVPNSKSYLLGNMLMPLKEQLRLRFVGYDIIEPNVELLTNNTLDFIVNQNPMAQGLLAVQALYQHLVLGVKVELNQFMPLDIITKENLKYANGLKGV